MRRALARCRGLIQRVGQWAIDVVTRVVRAVSAVGLAACKGLGLIAAQAVERLRKINAARRFDGQGRRIELPEKWLAKMGLGVALFALGGAVILALLQIGASKDDEAAMEAARAATLDLAVQSAVLGGVVAATNLYIDRSIAILFSFVFVGIDLFVRGILHLENAWVQTGVTALLVIQALVPLWWQDASLTWKGLFAVVRLRGTGDGGEEA